MLLASMGQEEGPHHLGCQEPGEGAGGAFLGCARAALVVVGGETPGNRADLGSLLAVRQQLLPATCTMLNKAQQEILLCITRPFAELLGARHRQCQC